MSENGPLIGRNPDSLAHGSQAQQERIYEGASLLPGGDSGCEMTARDLQREQACKRVLTTIRDGAMSRSKLADAIGWNYGKVGRLLTSLEALGRVERLKIRRYTYWQLPSSQRVANNPQAGNRAPSRTYTWSPLSGYDIEAHRRLALLVR